VHRIQLLTLNGHIFKLLNVDLTQEWTPKIQMCSKLDCLCVQNSLIILGSIINIIQKGGLYNHSISRVMPPQLAKMPHFDSCENETQHV
jgi:hypothetical protein